MAGCIAIFHKYCCYTKHGGITTNLILWNHRGVCYWCVRITQCGYMHGWKFSVTWLNSVTAGQIFFTISIIEIHFQSQFSHSPSLSLSPLYMAHGLKHITFYVKNIQQFWLCYNWALVRDKPQGAPHPCCSPHLAPYVARPSAIIQFNCMK